MALAATAVMAASALSPSGVAQATPSPSPTPPPLSPVTFTPAGPGASDTVDEISPDLPDVCAPNQPKPVIAAYPGALEIGREPNGSLYVITTMTFPDYLKGIAEVPASWPLAALEAQVVAARTYAMSHLGSSTVDGLRYDLCATDACQVYSGLSVANGAYGQDWVQAVDATTGQILEYNGKPIDALYFSTSNGHTYSNATVFGSAPLPYLQPVAENDDGGSPTSHWSVTMSLTDLAQILNQAGAWGTGPISSVVQQGAQQSSTIAIAGPGGSKTLSVSSFRNDVNNDATCLTPKRYPTPAAAGQGNLPQTVPSVWMNLTQQGDSIVMTGRGWGHGVGMVQWGAMGKAQRGLSYADILAYYYGGLKPVTVSEPGTIRILLATGLDQITVQPHGSVTVAGGSAGTTAGTPAGTPSGAVTITGGPSMTIAPATSVGGAAIPPTLALSAVAVTATASPGHPAGLSFTLNHAANAGLAYQGLAPGSPTGTVAPTPVQGGQASLSWDAVAEGLPAGTYQVAVVADDGVSRVVSDPVDVAVSSASPSPTGGQAAPAAVRPKKGTGPSWVLAVVGGFVAILVAAAAGAAAVLSRRKSP